jgi:hypothetical protein
MARGGRVAVNLTHTVSHLVALDAADTDPRYARTTHLLRLDPTTLSPARRWARNHREKRSH